MAATGEESVKVSNLKAVSDELQARVDGVRQETGTVVELYVTDSTTSAGVNKTSVTLARTMDEFSSLMVTVGCGYDLEYLNCSTVTVSTRLLENSRNRIGMIMANDGPTDIVSARISGSGTSLSVNSTGNVHIVSVYGII